MESEKEVAWPFLSRRQGFLSLPQSAQWPASLAGTPPAGWLPQTAQPKESACIPANAGCCSPLLRRKALLEELERWVPS